MKSTIRVYMCIPIYLYLYGPHFHIFGVDMHQISAALRGINQPVQQIPVVSGRLSETCQGLCPQAKSYDSGISAKKVETGPT